MTLAQRAPVARQLGGGERPPLVRELVGAVTEQLGSGRIECDRNFFAGFVAGYLDTGAEQLERFSVRAEVGSEAALVAHRGGEAVLAQRALQGVEHLHPHPQRLGEALRSHGHDHELLEVQPVVGVGASIEDVHHRHRQHVRFLAAEVAVERNALLGCGGLGGGERHSEDRVGAQALLVRGPVQLAEGAVESALVEGFEAPHRLRDLSVHRFDRTPDTLPAPCLAAVA